MPEGKAAAARPAEADKSSPYISLGRVHSRTFNTVAANSLRMILMRGRVPMVATRSDMYGHHPPDRMERLLANAVSTYFYFSLDCISANYSGFDEAGHWFKPSIEDRAALFGRHSDLATGLSVFDAIEFRDVRVHWPELVEVLEEAGLRRRPRLGGTPSGPKPGEPSVKELMWNIALGILTDGPRPPLGRGRLTALARLVNKAANKGHKDDSVRKIIRPSLREWERQNTR
jgi:hypothetical protein